MLKTGLIQNLASQPSFLIKILPEWPKDLVPLKEEIGSELSRLESPPQNLVWGGECRAVDGMTQITTQFSKTFQPKALTSL